MDASKTIRDAFDSVAHLRRLAADTPGLLLATREVKRLQAQRFAGTYADLLGPGPYQAAARFFLEELYGDRDYGERDAQFSRIAPAIESLFPARVVATAVSLAQLHALTENLDHAVANAWLARADLAATPPMRYVAAWRQAGRRPDRERQLVAVVALGQDLVRLTRLPGLRTMLRVMRAPASAAGLASLQRFLESGFDTFSAMARGGAGETFLRLVQERESVLLDLLFDADLVACETRLAQLLGQAR